MTIRRILKEFVSFVYDRVVTFLFGLYYYENRKFRIPRPNNEILFDDVETLAKKIKNRQVSCFDVISAYLDRLKTVNGLCNAAVDINDDRSLRDARFYDTLIEKNDPSIAERPLFGIPFTTKDSTAVIGMMHTLGLRARRNVRAEFDADFVKRLKKAGAICIAVTNLPELNLWQETRNLVFGNTLNPYDLNRTVGGSSGGEGCLVATNSTAFGMGTDIGGSIRGPSFYCGVFGHKTTVNAIQRRGTTLRESNETDTMVSIGPICRTAKDIAPLLKVLSVSEELVSKLDLPVDIENIQCYYIKEISHSFVRPVNDEMKKNFQRVLNYFDEKCSKKPIELKIPQLKHVNMLWRFWMSKERPAFETVLRKFDNFNLFWEIVLKFFGQSNYTLAALIKLIDIRMPYPDEKLAVELTNQIRNQLMNVLNNDHSILILPSYTSTAEYHYTQFLRPFDYIYWALFNIVKMPATQIPTGLSKNNLPLGIQVVAAPFNDYLCIAIAKEIENNLPTFIPPYPTR